MRRKAKRDLGERKTKLWLMATPRHTHPHPPTPTPTHTVCHGWLGDQALPSTTVGRESKLRLGVRTAAPHPRPLSTSSKRAPVFARREGESRCAKSAATRTSAPPGEPRVTRIPRAREAQAPNSAPQPRRRGLVHTPKACPPTEGARPGAAHAATHAGEGEKLRAGDALNCWALPGPIAKQPVAG